MEASRCGAMRILWFLYVHIINPKCMHYVCWSLSLALSPLASLSLALCVCVFSLPPRVQLLIFYALLPPRHDMTQPTHSHTHNWVDVRREEAAPRRRTTQGRKGEATLNTENKTKSRCGNCQRRARNYYK